MQANPVQPSWVSYAVPAALFVVVLALRFRRMGKMRPLKLGSLWVVPAIYIVLAAAMFIQLPPVGWVGPASLVGLAFGAAVGWQRGKMMRIHVDPETHDLNQKASPAAIIFLLVLIAIRAAGRKLLGAEGGVSPAMLTDPLLAFALGMLTLTRVEMYLRAKRMLEEARGGA